MSYGVTPTGFVKKTLPEIVTELNAVWRDIFPECDTDPDGEIGQRVGIAAQIAADGWDLAQEIYTSFNVAEVTGAAMDGLFGLIGIRRIDASATRVYHVLHWGANDTLISAGAKVRQANSTTLFSLQTDITISNTTPRAVKLDLEAPSDGKVYTLTLNTLTCTHTAGAASTKDTVGAALVAAIAAQFPSGTPYATYSSGTLIVWGALVDFALGALAALSIQTQATAGTYICDVEGVVAVPLNTLDTITTPASGWTGVQNPIDGTAGVLTGRLSETDEQFRIRASSYYQVGKGTSDAIRQAILNEVEGVISCSIINNRTNAAVGSLPAKSFEVTVEGGSDADIARVLWNTMPAGIESYGTTSTTVIDSQGRTQTVKFTRPAKAYIWVKVVRTLDTEAVYPIDGDQRIKDNIVAWSLGKYQSGGNVYDGDLLTPINLVPGMASRVVTFGNTTDGSVPTTYTATSIAIPSDALAVFATSRITVE